MDAFEVAWLLLKEEVEEEPPEDPTPPPMGFRQRVKNAMSNMGAMFGQGSLKDKWNTIRQQQAQQQQAHEEAFQAQQQALQDAQMAEQFGHQDPAQMRIEDFYGHDVNTEQPQQQEQPQQEQYVQGKSLFDYGTGGGETNTGVFNEGQS